ncbi:stage II sporulation protein D [Pelotomaculum sp. PtaB.Bin117]|uniref:stage II sporulation protein D n=1 Tax=Pelotomaculum sp. PtaB.Bin117 TaxID=1811694 RepID=UPI0009D38C38|nr:stage II sporulation protein D [Pelotomaculum sp. PtaB.Bin117]OPX91277.1 MAG: Amidase enhancer precursor [Pelotomaculum sp. PtaB.Bin117]
MRRLLFGAVLLITALILSIPYLADRQIPAKFFPGVTIVKMYIHKENKIQPLQLEDYLVGVVAAEMPAEFPLDALKAQAVAARTYIVKRKGAGVVVNSLHPGADVCDDPTHGQAWLSREDLKNRWGTLHYYNYYYKVKKAVDETSGQVLTWNGELIDPAYHASCGGRTENSEDVWQFQVPYLRSVHCPYDADPRSVQTAAFSLEQVDQALGTSLSAVPVTGGKNVSTELKLIERTSTGRPKSLLINGRQFSAVVVRDLLGLRSTNFTWTVNSGFLTFTTTGHGHGVGMCQYGAKGMAEHGYSYRVILSHYYSGAEITTYKTSSQ